MQMIKQALKGKKKKAVKKKAAKEPKVAPNGIERFFNDYGENPHL